MHSKRYAIYTSICIIVFVLGILTGYFGAASKKEYIYIENPSAAMLNPQEDVKKAPQPQETDRRTFFIQTLNEKLYVYLRDNNGDMQLDSEIDYVDIYSLDPAQREALSIGITLPDRESVAEYIQDLGS